MTLTKTTDHVDDAVSKLLTQFKDSVDVVAWLSSYVKQIQILEDMLFTLYLNRAIATATHEQLDAIGRIVQCLRDGMTDTDYRARLGVEILINKSSATMEEIIAILSALLPGNTFTTSDSLIAAFDIDIADPIANGLQISAIVQRIKAAGVRVVTAWAPSTTTAPYFSFGPSNDVNGNAAGFGPDASGGYLIDSGA